MRLVSFYKNGSRGVAVKTDRGWAGLLEQEAGYPGDLDELVAQGPDGLNNAQARLAKAAHIDLSEITFLPVLSRPGKIICIGLNYPDHSAESGFKQPTFPTLFARFNSSLIGHGAPIIRPRVSEQLDYEGELVAIIGKGGKNILKEKALEHVLGYSIFNDASIRDYQFMSPQWTMGKNFDHTGSFGPILVTADELPPGCLGLKLETRLNGQVMQSAMIDEMVFDVASQIVFASEAMTLSPGDVFVTGTPSGVGLARKPPVYMRPGDICEVEVNRIGILSNPIADELSMRRSE